MAIETTINGKAVSLAAEPDTPLLWVIREELGLTGTKFGCGIAACGACSVHVNGEVTRSCSVPVSEVAGKSITTIEGLKGADGTLHAVQQAWISAQVPQCGYCQSGQIMAAVALIEKTGKPSDAQIDEAMTNICRCGTYPRIRKAIRAATGQAANNVQGAA
jgi:isoquinoline 1-oxidoreductase subunit alpha